MVSYWFTDSAIAQGIEASFVSLVVLSLQGSNPPPSSIVLIGLGVMVLVGGVRSLKMNPSKEIKKVLG